MGHLDRALLSVRCPRSLKEALVFVRLSAGRRCNAQGAAIVRRPLFCPLAVVAKKMDPCAARTRRFRYDGGIAGFTMAPAQPGDLDRRRDCRQPKLVISSTAQRAPFRSV